MLTLPSISNQRKTVIKNNIIKRFQSLQKTSLIEAQLTLHKTDNQTKTQEPTLIKIIQSSLVLQ